MPIVKSYRRYQPANGGCLGVISSGTSTAFLNQKEVLTASLSTVSSYDIRTGEPNRQYGEAFDGNAVSAVAVTSNGKTLAVGHEDGTIKLWGVGTGEELVTFSGHRAVVNVLKFIENELQLVSGSSDTDVIVWDIVNECGVVRLHGHSGPVTDCVFLPSFKFLMTTSKDHFVKIWDLETQHCVQTMVGHRSEVNSIIITKDGKRVITGSNDNELRVWAILSREDATPEQIEASQVAEGVAMIFMPLGSLSRQSRERVVSLKLNGDGTLLACQGADKALEVFRFRSEEEIAKRLKRKAKRVREKNKEGKKEDEVSDVIVQMLEDEIFAMGVIRVNAKIKSFAFDPVPTSDGKVRIACALNNNSLETFDISPSGVKMLSFEKGTEISFAGHRTPIRAVAMSHDDELIVTTSNKRAKVWNREKRRCVRTLESNYGLCTAFVPGNRHVIVGNRSGELQLFDLASGKMLEEITDVHTGAIWSLDLQPDKHGFVTGGADKKVNFWEYELVADEDNPATKRLSCAHVKTLKMTDDVLCVKFSPDQRFLAVALLDGTVKVFYADTLKFFLSLYGHKLPVVCMDISRDNTMLVTGSGDKNIKLWGLDFGDCHKSFFAHQDTITSVKFLGISHYFFSVSKDKSIKLWDADKFEYVLTLQGHQAEISAMAVSANGSTMVSVSHDRSIRLWQRSNELINLEEEREIEREQDQDKEDADAEATVARARAKKEEAELPSKQNTETLKSADRLVEAIEMVEVEDAKQPGDQPNPILVAYRMTAKQYLLREISRVPSSDLESSLLVLPFAYAIKLIDFFEQWIKTGQRVERCSRCLFFLMKCHHNQIVGNGMLVPTLESLRESALPQITELKDAIGFNLAGLRFLQQEITSSGIRTFEDAEDIAAGDRTRTKKQKTFK